MKGAGVCVRGRERSHALKGLVVCLCLLEWNVSGWVLQNSAGAQVVPFVPPASELNAPPW